ncbi:MAG: CHAT domain-containing protein [Planctomycetota bacterium]|nr:MAG: CHAT domain-containing protein [Planctomycetota bacterium]
MELETEIEARIEKSDPVQHAPGLDKEAKYAPVLGKSYSLSVKASGLYSIVLKSYDFDPYLILLEAGGKVIAEDDDGLIGVHSKLLVELKEGIQYHVTACSLQGKTGAFSIKLAEADPTPLSGEQLDQLKDEYELGRIAHLEAKEGPNSLNVAKGLNSMGIRRWQTGRYREAEEYLTRALEIREKNLGTKHPDTATSLNNLAELKRTQGRYQESRSLHMRALAIREEVFGLEHPQTATSLNSLAFVLMAEGRLNQGRPFLERALRIRETALGPNHPLTAASLNNLAYLFRQQGRLREVIPLLRRALKIIESAKGPEDPHALTAKNNLAVALNRQGFFEEARELFEEILYVYGNQAGMSEISTARARNNLAMVLKNQGLSEEAANEFRRAIATFLKIHGESHPETAAAIGNLGNVLADLGKMDEAIPLLQTAYEIDSEVLGAGHSKTSQSLHNLAWANKSSGRLKEARRLYLSSLAALKENVGEKHPYTATNLHNLGLLCMDEGRLDEARSFMDQALEIRQACFGSSHYITAGSWLELGDLHSLVGRLKEAKIAYEQGLSSLLAHLDSELPTMSEAGRIRLLGRRNHLGPYLSLLAKMEGFSVGGPYEIFLKWKGKATRMQAAGMRLNEKDESKLVQELRDEISLVSKRLSEMIFLPIKDREKGHNDKVEELRRKRLQVERRLNQAFGLKDLQEAYSEAEIRSKLPENSALLDFFVGEEVFAWVFSEGSPARLISLGNSERIREQVEMFLASTSLRGGKPLEETEGQRISLLDSLWNPILPYVEGTDLIFISPDGFLGQLPFGALSTHDGRFLLEEFRFVYLSDATRIRVPAPGRISQEGRVLVVGDVNYYESEESGVQEQNQLNRRFDVNGRSRIGDRWPMLEATRDEIRAIKELHQYVLKWNSEFQTLDGKSATESNVKMALPGNRYIHLATHGFFEPDHLPSLLRDLEEGKERAHFGSGLQAVGLLPGLLSGLVFAGVNAEKELGRDDGYLTADEIEFLDLSSCDLAVLSACETALGSERAGEGLISLRRAFEIAGSKTVVSSLWKIDDRASATLMDHFYRNLWEKGLGKAESLHRAKLQMLQQNRLDFDGDARPSTWGAFVLSGDWY